jgi:hypothetical protein
MTLRDHLSVWKLYLFYTYWGMAVMLVASVIVTPFVPGITIAVLVYDRIKKP